VRPRTPGEPAELLPDSAFDALWNAAATAWKRDDLELALAAQLPPGAFAPFDRSAITAPTVGQACIVLGRAPLLVCLSALPSWAKRGSHREERERSARCTTRHQPTSQRAGKSVRVRRREHSFSDTPNNTTRPTTRRRGSPPADR
jgi:hypothetical protein